MNKVSRPESDKEALIMALWLAITAPDEETKADAVHIADAVAGWLTPEEVATCKAIAAEMAKK